MIHDSLGLVSAALATQTEWKLSLTTSGGWELKKRARRPLQDPSLEESAFIPEAIQDPMGEFVYVIE